MMKKKKVGIITIIDYYNLGNRLQNYAVSYLLNERFNCRAVTLEGYRKRPSEGNLRKAVKEKVALQLCRFPKFAENHLNPRMIRWFNFSEWSKKWIPRQRLFVGEKLPNELNGQFDLFIAGSDQIWNYRINNLRLEDNLLTFVSNKKKVALSASFGVDDIPGEQKRFFGDSLSQFAFLSVREKTGAKIIKELTGRSVPVLIDPVMMLTENEWKRVEKKPRVDITKSYVLKYFLGPSDNSIDRWASDNNITVYELMNEQKRELYSVGPGEFLSLIRNASLICSDSFHCLALAILFSKPFIAYERQGTENYMGSRIETLLSKYKLQNRRSEVLLPEEFLKCDFSKVQIYLGEERNAFTSYLTEAIQSL